MLFVGLFVHASVCLFLFFVHRSFRILVNVSFILFIHLVVYPISVCVSVCVPPVVLFLSIGLHCVRVCVCLHLFVCFLSVHLCFR